MRVSSADCIIRAERRTNDTIKICNKYFLMYIDNRDSLSVQIAQKSQFSLQGDEVGLQETILHLIMIEA